MSGKMASTMKSLFHQFLVNQTEQSAHVILQRAFSRFGDRYRQLMFGDGGSKLAAWTQSVNHKLNVMSKAFAQQCNGLAVQRLRRTNQILELYKQLYGDRICDKVIKRLGIALLRQCKTNRVCLLLGSLPFFTWEKDKITDEEIESYVEEMNLVHAKVHHVQFSENKSIPGGWGIVIDRPNLKVWRRPVGNTYLYEYKVYGRFYDVSSKSFYNVQVDTDFRRQWDVLTLDIQVIDRDEKSQSEVIHWISKFPYPMYARDYVYVRRSEVDPAKKVMVITAHSVNHPSCPVSDSYVRVTDYQSTMVIKPHTVFEENGLDYILTYFDDPQANFPTFAYNWMASTGVPDFLEKVHQAALIMQENQKSKSRTKQNDSGTYSAQSQYA